MVRPTLARRRGDTTGFRPRHRRSGRMASTMDAARTARTIPRCTTSRDGSDPTGLRPELHRPRTTTASDAGTARHVHRSQPFVLDSVRADRTQRSTPTLAIDSPRSVPDRAAGTDHGGQPDRAGWTPPPTGYPASQPVLPSTPAGRHGWDRSGNPADHRAGRTAGTDLHATPRHVLPGAARRSYSNCHDHATRLPSQQPAHPATNASGSDPLGTAGHHVRRAGPDQPEPRIPAPNPPWPSAVDAPDPACGRNAVDT